MLVVYIAGPIRAESAWLREANIRRAEALALEVWVAGGFAVCMHAMTRNYCEKEVPFDIWMKGDLEILRRCDAVLTVEGWEKSQGAQMEVAEANRLGLPVVHSMWALRVLLSRDRIDPEDG